MIKPEPTGVGKQIQQEIEKLITLDFRKDTLKVRFGQSLRKVLDIFKEYLREEIITAYKNGVEKAKSKVPDTKRTEYNESEQAAKQRAQEAYNKFYEGIGQAFASGYRTIASEIAKDENLLTYEKRKQINDKLVEKGYMKIQYANGANIPVDAYAEMVANTSSIEAFNTGALDYATKTSTLVQMTEIFPTCQICAKYQGRVYSVDGSNKRYPSLYDTVLSRGYNTVHPNCRHEFLPYYEEFRMAEEVQADRDKSNRPFIDARSKRNKDTYKTWQRVNAETRERKNKKLYKQTIPKE